MAGKSLLKQSGLVLLVLLSLIACLWAVSRLIGPTSAQERALTLMWALPPVEGRDAFTALWFIGLDIPEAEHAHRLDKTLDRIAAAGMIEGEDGDVANGLPTQDDLALFCGSEPGCLDRVASDRGRYVALVRRHAGLIDRVERLSAYSGVRHFSDESLSDNLLPPYHVAKVAATRHALDFIDGRQVEAFDGTCRAATTWRRLGANSDTLISRLIFSQYLAAGVYGQLFADMLARVPRDFRLPSSCRDAFSSPEGLELSLCLSGQGELRFADRLLRKARSEATGLGRLLTRAGLSRDMALAERAERWMPYCDGTVDEALRADLPYSRPARQSSLWRIQCAGNPVGCMTEAMSEENTDEQVSRIADGNAKLRLIALVLRSRQDGLDAAQFARALRSPRAGIGSPARAPVIGADGGTVGIRMYVPRPAPVWSIPLPPYLRMPLSSGPSDASATPASAFR